MEESNSSVQIVVPPKQSFSKEWSSDQKAFASRQAYCTCSCLGRLRRCHARWATYSTHHGIEFDWRLVRWGRHHQRLVRWEHRGRQELNQQVPRNSDISNCHCYLSIGWKLNYTSTSKNLHLCQPFAVILLATT